MSTTPLPAKLGDDRPTLRRWAPADAEERTPTAPGECGTFVVYQATRPMTGSPDR